jgi:hypothetical protein
MKNLIAIVAGTLLAAVVFFGLVAAGVFTLN